MRRNLVGRISRSRKPVTILFTDIVDSTRYWFSKGDIEGRLMVDQHNRLVFPIIRKFKGTIVKTIGDAVMASFQSQEQAIQAAIGIQQALHLQRQRSPDFVLELRIGIHTGHALVEKKDIFGDVVNVASRVESFAQPNEILISGSTVQGVDKALYRLRRKTSFVPRGKSQSITVFECNWAAAPNQIKDVNFNSVMPILARQKRELFVYALASIALLVFIFHQYLRFLMVDQQKPLLMSLNTLQWGMDHPVILALAGVAITLLLLFLRSLVVFPLNLFRVLKGGLGYAIVFMLTLGLLQLLPDEYAYNSHRLYYESQHRFVEVLQADSPIHDEPDIQSGVVDKVGRFGLYPLLESRKIDTGQWYKLALDKSKQGWIQEIRPAAIGIPEVRLSELHGFRFYYADAYALLAGLLGFVWGFFSFSVRPV